MPKLSINFCDWCGYPVKQKDLITMIIKKDSKYKLCGCCVDAVHCLHTKLAKNISNSLYANVDEYKCTK